MPRAATDPQTLIERALPLFWHAGYDATSIDDLVAATGSSRHALYSAFGDKRGLLLGCIAAYRDGVVDGAFAPVERPGASLATIAAYFEQQIAAAEVAGLPGPGCLLANLMTEIAPHDPDVAAAVRDHLDRLRAGFVNALYGGSGAGSVPRDIVDGWATVLVTIAQGLWSTLRVATDGTAARLTVAVLLDMLDREFRR